MASTNLRLAIGSALLLALPVAAVLIVALRYLHTAYTEEESGKRRRTCRRRPKRRAPSASQ